MGESYAVTNLECCFGVVIIDTVEGFLFHLYMFFMWDTSR